MTGVRSGARHATVQPSTSVPKGEGHSADELREDRTRPSRSARTSREQYGRIHVGFRQMVVKGGICRTRQAGTALVLPCPDFRVFPARSGQRRVVQYRHVVRCSSSNGRQPCVIGFPMAGLADASEPLGRRGIRARSSASSRPGGFSNCHSKRVSLTVVGFASGPFSSVFEVSHSVSRPSKRNVKIRKLPSRISAGFFAVMRLVVSSLPLIS